MVVVVVVVVVVVLVVVVVVTRGSGGVGHCVLTGTSGEPAVQACVSNAIVFNGVSLLLCPDPSKAGRVAGRFSAWPASRTAPSTKAGMA